MDPRALSRRDLRRLVSDMWPDDRCDGIASEALDAAVAANAKSLDRSVLTAYLRHFPRDHPAFERLRAASALTADRHDWAWRARGEKWQLWDEDAGPARIAAALLASDDPAMVLRETGLDGDLAQGEFMADALEAACEQAGQARGDRAQLLGTRLIALFDRLAVGGMEAMLAWALLAPWEKINPPKIFSEKIAKLLIARFGDPRLASAKWQAIKSDMQSFYGGSVDEIVGVLRRWIVRSTVGQFFNVVARTTDNPEQWAQRTKFWTDYLEADVIRDAWFVLGPRADSLFRSYADIDLPHGKIRAGDGGAGHSALIMAVGNLLIAEWSDNGACRFWPERHADAPELGGTSYYRSKLKARTGENGFEKIAHLPSPGWEPKFANKIYRETGLTHTRHGTGFDSRGWR